MKCSKYTKLILVIISLVGMWSGRTFVARADNGQSDIFSVSVNLPQNQLPNGHSYFDLKLHKHHRQTISVTVFNNSHNPIKVQSAIRDAYMNNNGTIAYGQLKLSSKLSKQYQMSKITKLQSTKPVIIPAQSSKKIKAWITLPKDGYQQGVVLGGWYFKQIDQLNHTISGVRNQYSYLIGLKYTLTKEVQPKLSLHRVLLTKKNPQSLLLQLTNSKAALVPNLKYDVNIYQEHKKTPLLHYTLSGGSFAPRSSFKLAVPLKGKVLKSGRYLAKVNVENAQNKWQLVKKFGVAKDGALKQ